MDHEVFRLLAHIDQARAEVQDILMNMPRSDVAALIKTCADGRLGELDERVSVLTGLAAVMGILDMCGDAMDIDREEG